MRLKQHLIGLGEWSDEQHEAFESQATEEIRAQQVQAESIGTLTAGKHPDPATLFENVFEEPDWRHASQRRELEG